MMVIFSPPDVSIIVLKMAEMRQCISLERMDASTVSIIDGTVLVAQAPGT